MRAGRDFLVEHPQGSDLWQLADWQLIAKLPQVYRVLIHQCMLGLLGPRSGLPIKKPTEIWASNPTLVKYLHNKLCDGRHVHSQLDAREAGAPADKAKDAQRRPLPMCRNMARGCDERLQQIADKRTYAQCAPLPLLTRSPRKQSVIPCIQCRQPLQAV